MRRSSVEDKSAWIRDTSNYEILSDGIITKLVRFGDLCRMGACCTVSSGHGEMEQRLSFSTGRTSSPNLPFFFRRLAKSRIKTRGKNTLSISR